MRSIEQEQTTKRQRPHIWRWIILVSVALTVATACGSSSEKGIGAQTGTETSLPATEQDADAADLGEEEAGDDSAEEVTEDDAPEPDGGAASEGDYQFDPLPAQNSGEVLAALVEELHGSTNDLAREVNRLTLFPKVPTPPGARLTSMEASTNNSGSGSAERFFHRVLLRVQVDGTPEELQRLFESELTASEWTLTATEYDIDRFIEQEHERRTYSRPLDNGEDEKLTVTSIVFDPTILHLEYKVNLDDDALTKRFQGWISDEIPIPQLALFDSVTISTTFGPGQTTLNLLSSFGFEAADSPARAELLAEVEDLTASSPYSISSGGPNGVFLGDLVNYDLFRVSVNDGHVGVSAERKFDTPEPGIPAPEADPDQSTEPIGDNASPEEFAALLGEMHGPTVDLSAQMRRLGAFPDLPTPLGANIVDLSVGQLSTEDPDTLNTFSTVEAAVSGDFDEVDTFYRAQLAAGGWELKSTEPKTGDDVTDRVVHSYTHPDIEESYGFPLTVDVFDKPVNANVRVLIRYNEDVLAAEVNLDRWLGWEGDAPIPDGSDLTGTSVSSSRWVGDAASLTATYHVAGMDEAQVTAAVEAAAPGSDYTRNPDLDRTGFGDLDFTHPLFERVGVKVRPAIVGDGSKLTLEARFPFTRQD